MASVRSALPSILATPSCDECGLRSKSYVYERPTNT
jgi:hypothetical protein